jgi:hypothetical protein
LYDPLVVETCLKLVREKGFRFDKDSSKFQVSGFQRKSKLSMADFCLRPIGA